MAVIRRLPASVGFDFRFMAVGVGRKLDEQGCSHFVVSHYCRIAGRGLRGYQAAMVARGSCPSFSEISPRKIYQVSESDGQGRKQRMHVTAHQLITMSE